MAATESDWRTQADERGDTTVKPLWQRWVVENPVFRYHFLGQTRLAVARPLWQVLAVASPFAVIYFWLTYQVATNGLPAFVITLEVFALCLLAPLMTHSLFAMEFERATWDMLVLTRLTAGQIVMGKFLSRLVMLLVFGFLFTPLLWMAANREFNDMASPLMVLWGQAHSVGGQHPIRPLAPTRRPNEDEERRWWKGNEDLWEGGEKSSSRAW